MRKLPIWPLIMLAIALLIFIISLSKVVIGFLILLTTIFIILFMYGSSNDK